MVTAAAALLMLGALADLPAAARGPDAPLRAPWSGLFGEPRVKPRRAAASVPLPKPRPADAPASGSEQPAAAPLVPAVDDKAVAQPAPQSHPLRAQTILTARRLGRAPPNERRSF